MSLLQAEVERRGTQIFDLVDRHPESIFSKAGFYQRLMEFSMRDEHFKVQMFRFVDVLASLRRGSAQWLRSIHPHRGVARAYRTIHQWKTPALECLGDGAAVHRRAQSG